MIQTRNFEEAEYLLCATKNGVVKKTRLAEYNTPLKADGIIAIKMRENDELVALPVLRTPGDDVLLVSRKGQAIRFSESDSRAMGRATEGVRGMSLRAEDEVIAAEIAPRRLGPAGRHRERVREAHPGVGVSTQGPRRHGRPDGQAQPGPRPACRRTRRP